MIGKWKSLVDTLQVDLRNISSEAKRKHPAVKDAAERAILKLRSLSAANDKHINEGKEQLRRKDFSTKYFLTHDLLIPHLLFSVIARSDDVIQPFILGCETKSAKLIFISINCIQRLISHDAVPDTSITVIIKMLSK